MMVLHRLFAYVTLSFVITRRCQSQEPSPCESRFDYDHRMMRKILELESRVQKLEETRTVSFMAELSESLVNPPVGKIVVFDKVHSHNTNAYNSNTGIFTALYSGVYMFSLVAASSMKAKGNLLHLYMMKNSEQIGYVFLDNNHDRWLGQSTTAVVSLEAGDQVYVKIGTLRHSGTLAGCCFHTVLSGILIN